MLNSLRNRLKGEEGFTLIELLVVILIIGILAAIAIPSFLNQKGKGEDSKAKADARTTQTALETYYTDNQDYNCGTPAACVTKLQAIEPQVPAGATVTQGTSTYTIAVPSTGNRSFSIAKSGGTTSRTCLKLNATDTDGGCKIAAGATSGSW